MSEDDERAVFVPLRSNAYSLLAGAPAARLRQRLKQASVTFDSIFLEGGALHVTAGPDGSMTMPAPVDAGANFQTARQRADAQRAGFVLSVGAETVPGVPSTSMRPLIQSKTTIQWAPTLRPYVSELEASSCDWVHMVSPQPDSSVKRTANDWKRTDERSEALRLTLPEQFVRSVVIGNANRDLALAAHGGVAVMQDAMHQQVVRGRFEDDEGWQARGFALPLLLPEVGGMDWETVRRIRNHRSMRDFRRLLQEIEVTTLDEARSGDLEAAVRHAMGKRWVAAVGKVESLGAIPRVAAYEFGFGVMTGVLTAGFVGPAGITAGAGAGATFAAIHSTVSTIKSRRRKGWVSVYNELSQSTNH